MTWFNILKFYTPKQFMQDLQEMLGGEYHGGSASSRGKGYYKNPSTSFSYYLQQRECILLELMVKLFLEHMI